MIRPADACSLHDSRIAVAGRATPKLVGAHAEAFLGELRQADQRPGREEALAALRTVLSYLGEDPQREGLLETPDRVLRAYDEFFAGYRQDPAAVLRKTFDEEAAYTGPVLVRDIELQSHCEHHMVAFTGLAHVAYLPAGRIVGLSKLARLVDVFARRLQIQERLTAQIANTLQDELAPHGTLVVVEAEHHCMATRGVKKRGSRTVTMMATGVYRDDERQRAELLRQLGL